MTREQAVREFKELYADYIKKHKTDYCAKQLAWSMYTDSLCKEGRITDKQYDTWSCPFKPKY